MALAREDDPEAAAEEEERTETRERVARHRAAYVRRGSDDEEQPEGEDGRFSDDVVDRAFRLVGDERHIDRCGSPAGESAARDGGKPVEVAPRDARAARPGLPPCPWSSSAGNKHATAERDQRDKKRPKNMKIANATRNASPMM
jgi:hypothetical protein